jgi:hypothetical protein
MVDVGLCEPKELAAAPADHSQIERAFVRDELVDVLKQISHEESDRSG